MKNRKLYMSQVIPACAFGLFVLNMFGTNLSLSTEIYTEKYFDYVDGNITVNDVTVNAPGNVKLTAGQTIKLQTDFKVNAGGFFHALVLQDPKIEGPYSYNTSPIYYASSSGAQKLARYQSPTTNYGVSRRLDVSQFVTANQDLDYNYWGFNKYSVPINGIIRMPTSGTGPYPLAIFVHGHSADLSSSDEGYDYLCKLLASHGIIAASIDENFFNLVNNHCRAARAIVLLEHINQFKIWNEDNSSHPLYGKVDMTKIMLVGHSRGGEAVEYVSYFNRLGSVAPKSGPSPVLLNGGEPFNFSLEALVAIAPTQGYTANYDPVGVPQSVEDNYFMMAGSRDDDVDTIVGQKTYDRAHMISSNPVTSAEGFKSLLYIHGANHCYFNSSWEAEVTTSKITDTIDYLLSHSDPEWESDIYELEYDYNDGLPTLTREEQENVAKVYIGALAQALLLGNAGYLELFKDHDFGKGWLPDTDYVSQYQPRERLLINHYEEDTNPYTLSAGTGSNSWSGGVAVDEISFDSGAKSVLFQETKGVKLSWTSAGGYYQTSFSSGYELDASGFDFIAIRVGQSDESNNTLNVDQDFTIEVKDASSNESSFTASSLTRLVYPDRGSLTYGYTVDFDGLTALPRRTVMQTIRIPLSSVAGQGVDITKISSIKFIMDQTSSGTIYFDELQLTNE